jgi:hypothetical protein
VGGAHSVFQSRNGHHSIDRHKLCPKKIEILRLPAATGRIGQTLPFARVLIAAEYVIREKLCEAPLAQAKPPCGKPQAKYYGFPQTCKLTPGHNHGST